MSAEPGPGPSKKALPGAGLAKGLATTFKTMTQKAVTAQYPDVQPELPPRSRGVIALLEENCTSCMLCARECPDWCIYIDSHKETVPAAEPGQRDRTRNVLDRFAIDYSLCMYCGICIEVCPFDALFWSPEFEYAEFDIVDLLHEKDRLREWMWTVPPPPAHAENAEPAKEVAAAQKAVEKAAAKAAAPGAGAAAAGAAGDRPAKRTAAPEVPPGEPEATAGSAGPTAAPESAGPSADVAEPIAEPTEPTEPEVPPADSSAEPSSKGRTKRAASKIPPAQPAPEAPAEPEAEAPAKPEPEAPGSPAGPSASTEPAAAPEAPDTPEEPTPEADS